MSSTSAARGAPAGPAVPSGVLRSPSGGQLRDGGGVLRSPSGGQLRDNAGFPATRTVNQNTPPSNVGRPSPTPTPTTQRRQSTSAGLLDASELRKLGSASNLRGSKDRGRNSPVPIGTVPEPVPPPVYVPETPEQRELAAAARGLIDRMLEYVTDGPRDKIGAIDARLVTLAASSYTGDNLLKVNGLYEGQGEIVFHGGEVYVGDIHEGAMHGRGKYRWTDGTEYEGSFDRNKLVGEGIYRWADGSTYQGQVKNSLRHGKGTLTLNDPPIKYTGDWVDGCKHGKGIMFYDRAEKSFYEGSWRRDVKHGKGVMVYLSGNSYEGEWFNDVKHGYGSMQWVTSDEEYIGQWRNGLQHGFGEHTWYQQRTSNSQYALRNRYKGNWVGGKRHGVGVFDYAGGSGYRGEWKDNLKHGDGVVVFEDGAVYEGKFADDHMVDQNKEDAGIDAGIRLDLDDLLAPSGPDRARMLQSFTDVLLRHVTALRVLYKRYAEIADGEEGEFGDNVHCVSRQQMWKLLLDCNYLSRGWTLAELDVVMWPAYVEGRLKASRVWPSYDSPHHPSQMLMRRDFYECFVRLAVAEFHRLPPDTAESPASQLNTLLTTVVIPALDLPLPADAVVRTQPARLKPLAPPPMPAMPVEIPPPPDTADSKTSSKDPQPVRRQRSNSFVKQGSAPLQRRSSKTDINEAPNKTRGHHKLDSSTASKVGMGAKKLSDSKLARSASKVAVEKQEPPPDTTRSATSGPKRAPFAPMDPDAESIRKLLRGYLPDYRHLLYAPPVWTIMCEEGRWRKVLVLFQAYAHSKQRPEDTLTIRDCVFLLNDVQLLQGAVTPLLVVDLLNDPTPVDEDGILNMDRTVVFLEFLTLLSGLAATVRVDTLLQLHAPSVPSGPISSPREVDFLSHTHSFENLSEPRNPPQFARQGTNPLLSVTAPTMPSPIAAPARTPAPTRGSPAVTATPASAATGPSVSRLGVSTVMPPITPGVTAATPAATTSTAAAPAAGTPAGVLARSPSGNTVLGPAAATALGPAVLPPISQEMFPPPGVNLEGEFPATLSAFVDRMLALVGTSRLTQCKLVGGSTLEAAWAKIDEERRMMQGLVDNH